MRLLPMIRGMGMVLAAMGYLACAKAQRLDEVAVDQSHRALSPVLLASGGSWSESSVNVRVAMTARLVSRGRLDSFWSVIPRARTWRLASSRVVLPSQCWRRRCLRVLVLLPSGADMCQMVERGPVLSVPSTVSECFTPQTTG